MIKDFQGALGGLDFRAIFSREGTAWKICEKRILLGDEGALIIAKPTFLPEEVFETYFAHSIHLSEVKVRRITFDMD